MRGRFRFVAHALLGALALSCSDDADETGEVMIVVTTDMAVPTDLDELHWSVAPSGATEPFRQGVFELGTNEDLPATLLVTAGPKTTGPLTVRIEGRKPGADPTLRVVQEATFRVPRGRTAALDMPLSYLCSAANLSEACPADETCRGGRCVPSTVDAATLPDYVEPAPKACLDVLSCFDGAMYQLLPERSETGECTISGMTPLGLDADVNAALVVDRDAVGNYGFCNRDYCYVLLPRNDSPEGVRVISTDAVPRIRLPDAVCDAVDKGVSAVSVFKPTQDCPTFHGDTPLCEPPPDTCWPANTCPEDWPNAWSGYACSGKAEPGDVSEERLVACFDPADRGEGNPAAVNGRFCCTTGEPPADDPLVIDDMSGGPQIKLALPEGQIDGFWWTSVGIGSGVVSPAPAPALFTYRTFDPPVIPENGPEIRAAACMKATWFMSWNALMGVWLSGTTFDNPSFDVSGYDGISFWGWAAEPLPDAPLTVEVTLSTIDTRWGDKNAKCWTKEDQSARCDNFYDEVSLANQWQRHSVRWSDLHQSPDDWNPPQYRPPGGFDRNIYEIMFVVRGPGPEIMGQPFDFCVADLRFIPKSEAP